MGYSPQPATNDSVLVTADCAAAPKTIVLANWISDGLYTPGIGSMHPPTDDARKAVRKPTGEFEVYVIDQDYMYMSMSDYMCMYYRYGYETGWAVGSLIVSEKMLQAEIGLEKPNWLDADWYAKNVVQRPEAWVVLMLVLIFVLMLGGIAYTREWRGRGVRWSCE